MSSTLCPSIVPAYAANVPADVLVLAGRPVEQARSARELVQQWAGAAHLMNAMSLLPMGVDQGTGVSSTGFVAGDVTRFRSTKAQFTTHRGPRVRTGTG